MNKEKRYGSAMASYRDNESLDGEGTAEYVGNRPTKSPMNCSRNLVHMSNLWTKEEDIKGRLNELETSMYRATVNKQGHLKRY